jgi:hypothetical protein
MSWEALVLDVLLEFLNTFVIKGTYIYFGHKDNVYVIGKQLTIDIFGICSKGYVKDSKGQVSKSLVVQTLQSCKITPTNFAVNQWNAKSLGLQYFVKYLIIIYVIY